MFTNGANGGSSSSSNSSVFESLETRRMFSASVNPAFGYLLVQGSGTADQVTIGETFRAVNLNTLERFITVTEGTGKGAQTSMFRASGLTGIVVNTEGGDDVITINTSMGAKVYAGGGNDRITGGSGGDELYGDGFYFEEIAIGTINPGGNDVIFGNGGNDYIEGNGGNDELHGGANNDVIDGGAGVDKMLGEAGNDTLRARDGNVNEIVDGGDGTDTATIDDILVPVTSGPLAGASVRVRDSLFSVELITR